MTKEQLRDDYVSNGWEVQPVANWTLVSEVEGKKKYDVLAASPDNRFGHAQVVVTDDGGQAETAVAEGFWKTTPNDFAVDARTYADTLEAGQVFAISFIDVRSADEVATVNVFMNDGSKKTFVLKRRSGTFSYKELI